MNEKRFTIKSTATELELYDNGVKIGEFPHYEWVARPVDYVVKTLNEQQATINELTKNRDRWRELAKLHNGYFNCLEKAIEKAYEEKPYPKIEDIMDIYSELEKEFEDE